MTSYVLSAKNRLIYDSSRIHDSFPMCVKGRSVMRIALTNAAIRLASGSSCCSKKMEMSEVSTFRRVIVTESFIYIFYLTRIRRQFVVHFCRHRGKFAGKDGRTSNAIRGKSRAQKISVKNYMSYKRCSRREELKDDARERPSKALTVFNTPRDSGRARRTPIVEYPN